MSSTTGARLRSREAKKIACKGLQFWSRHSGLACHFACCAHKSCSLLLLGPRSQWQTMILE